MRNIPQNRGQKRARQDKENFEVDEDSGRNGCNSPHDRAGQALDILCARLAHFAEHLDRFAFRVEKIAGMALVETDRLRGVPVTLEKSLGGFVEKIFDFNGERYGVVDFELLVHAIIRNHL